jgi:hypothetical protein
MGDRSSARSVCPSDPLPATTALSAIQVLAELGKKTWAPRHSIDVTVREAAWTSGALFFLRNNDGRRWARKRARGSNRCEAISHASNHFPRWCSSRMKNPARRLQLTKAWLPWLRLLILMREVLRRAQIRGSHTRHDLRNPTKELLLVYLRCKDIFTGGNATRG